jgi:hypothetical protein
MPIDFAASTNGNSRIGADHAGDGGDQRDRNGDDDVRQRGTERRRHHQRQHQQGQRLQNVGDALEQQVDPA